MIHSAEMSAHEILHVLVTERRLRAEITYYHQYQVDR
jgi:hypothetical protein